MCKDVVEQQAQPLCQLCFAMAEVFLNIGGDKEGRGVALKRTRYCVASFESWRVADEPEEDGPYALEFFVGNVQTHSDSFELACNLRYCSLEAEEISTVVHEKDFLNSKLKRTDLVNQLIATIYSFTVDTTKNTTPYLMKLNLVEYPFIYFFFCFF